jgi:putative spermidine/putrescine transport system permease protein
MGDNRRDGTRLILLAAPAFIVFAAFFLLPVARLVAVAGEGPDGLATYAAILTNPRYFRSLVATVLLSAAVSLATLAICGVAGVFLERNRFAGRPVLVAMMTLPLSFPGVVVGFMVIILGGRQGLIGEATLALFGEKLVFAYSMAGLFVGYLYFSIPRVVLTVMAAAEKLDPKLEEAARSLGASSWAVARDVIVPGLMPAFVSSGAIAFATAMGAFGTAFTLATNIDVLPMTIYTEFTLNANFATAASLSLALGAITWIALALARTAAGTTVAAAG